MKINLCFITDEGYALPTCVSISSLAHLKTNNIYICHVLCRSISKGSIDKILKLATPNLQIKIINLDNSLDLSTYSIEGIPATTTSIYKFFIPEILPNLDKIIYLDGDTIIHKDLAELYNVELGNNYMGAVKDTNGLDYKAFSNRRYSYVNSGVLLMDLEKMRRNNTSEKLFAYRKNGFNKLMDQDTFNHVLKGKIKLLPFKYNTQTNALSYAIERKSGYNLEKFKEYWDISAEVDSVEDAFNDAAILHYATAKPWKYYDGFGNDLWLYHYLTSPYATQKLSRTSLYISKIVSSTNFRLGKMITSPVKKLKALLKNRNNNYKKFLENFK